MWIRSRKISLTQIFFLTTKLIVVTLILQIFYIVFLFCRCFHGSFFNTF